MRRLARALIFLAVVSSNGCVTYLLSGAIEAAKAPTALRVAPVERVTAVEEIGVPRRYYCVSVAYADGSSERFDVQIGSQLDPSRPTHDPAHLPGRSLAAGSFAWDGRYVHIRGRRESVKVRAFQRVLEWSKPRYGLPSLLSLLVPVALAVDLAIWPLELLFVAPFFIGRDPI